MLLQIFDVGRNERIVRNDKRSTIDPRALIYSPFYPAPIGGRPRSQNLEIRIYDVVFRIAQALSDCTFADAIAIFGMRGHDIGREQHKAEHKCFHDASP